MSETGAWMPMYWSDYFGDTLHLTTEEHGAYLLLIGAYWLRGRPLPDDDRYLMQVTKTSKKRWRGMKSTIAALFDVRDGEWRHKRVQNEILKSSGRLHSARAAGKAGGIAKAVAKSYLTTTTSFKESESPTSRQSLESNLFALERDAPSAKPTGAALGNGHAKPPRQKGTRLPDDWDPGDEGRAWALAELTLSSEQIEYETEKFKDHWLAQSGPNALKFNWNRAWKNWLRKADERLRDQKRREEAWRESRRH